MSRRYRKKYRASPDRMPTVSVSAECYDLLKAESERRQVAMGELVAEMMEAYA